MLKLVFVPIFRSETSLSNSVGLIKTGDTRYLYKHVVLYAQKEINQISFFKHKKIYLK